MRIFTLSRFLFINRKTDETCETLPKSFCDAPEWVKDDLQFRRGVVSGEIEVIESREKQLKVEKAAADGKKPALKTAEKTTQKATEKPANQ